MNRFVLLCWFVFALALPGAVAQNPQTARLKRELAVAKTDTSRVLLMAEISGSYRYSQFDSALAYAQRGLALAVRIRYPKGEGRCLAQVGELNAQRGNLPLGFRQSLEAQQLNELSGDWLGLTRTYNILGLIYLSLEDYPQARDYFLRGKAVFAQQSVQDDRGLSMLDCNVGTTYLEQKRLDSARYFVERAYQLALRSTTIHRNNRGSPLPFILRELGRIQVRLGHPEQGLRFHWLSIQAGQAENNQRSTTRTFETLTEEYRLLNQPDSSAFYAHKALTAAQALPLITGVLHSSTILSGLYKTQNQPDSALKYLEIAVAARDSLFNQRRIQELQGINFDEQRRVRRIEAERERFESQVKLYALLSGLAILLVGTVYLLRTNRQQRRANKRLHDQKKEIDQQRATAENTLLELKTTQAQLIQSEKMASLGELTAGIAHEIQNPLNFVNNFSEVSVELIGELREELQAGQPETALEIADDLTQNLVKISQHGQRASSIVRGMLEHARTSNGERQPTDLNALADEALRLSYHGLRRSDVSAKDKAFNARLMTDFAETLPAVDVIPQDLSRVFLNLFNNAFYAVQEKQKGAGAHFKPEVSVSTRQTEGGVEIRVRDNGSGIPAAVREKIFQPFFTTKPAGQGTGLGLSLSYDIVTQGHGGTLKVDTAEGEFTEFAVTLPVSARLAGVPVPK